MHLTVTQSLSGSGLLWFRDRLVARFPTPAAAYSAIARIRATKEA